MSCVLPLVLVVYVPLTFTYLRSDNDQYSHVNNAIYYYLIDSIVNTYLEERCGCKPALPSSGKTTSEDSPPIGLVISSQCTFLAPSSFPEPITLGLRVVYLGRSSVTYEVGFFSEGEGEDKAKAVGGYTHVFVDRVTRRSIKQMPASLRTGLMAVLNDAGNGSAEKAKL